MIKYFVGRVILEVGLKTEYNVHMFSTEKDVGFFLFLFLQKGKEMKQVIADWSTAHIREDVVAWVGHEASEWQ